MDRNNIKVKRANVSKKQKITMKKSLLKKIYIFSACIIFVALLITTIIIATKNSKDYTEVIKEIPTTFDPHFFITSTPTPSPDETDQEPDLENSEAIAWIVTSQHGSTVNVRSAPDVNSEEVGKIEDRKQVAIIGITDVKDDGHKWYKLVYENVSGFVRGDFIALTKPSDNIPDVIYGAQIKDAITGETMYSKLDYVQRVAPNVKTIITLATSDNFVNKRMYSANIAMIQRSTGEKLRKASSVFAADGYQLVLWDAYRPYSVTKKLYAEVKDVYLTANPSKGSKHNRGAAVDVTLYKDEKPVNMPTDSRVMDLKQSSRTSSMSKEQRAFMDYLTKVMEESGFTTYDGEWWHFNDTDWEIYPIMDYPLSDFE